MNILRGLGVPPAIVGLARGMVEAGLLAALAFLAGALPGISNEEPWQIIAPVLVVGIRFLEGLVDQIDPSKTRGPA